MAVARALINHPKIILADEPTGNLDEENERIVIDLIRELHAAGHTILMVTHDASIAQLADRRIELAHGRLVQVTTFTAEDEERFDHLLEQIWICGEEGVPAQLERVRSRGVMDAMRMVGRLSDRGLVEVGESVVTLTPRREKIVRAMWFGGTVWRSASLPTRLQLLVLRLTRTLVSSSILLARNWSRRFVLSWGTRGLARMGIRFRRGRVVRGMGIDSLRKIKWRMFSIVSHGRAEQAAPLRRESQIATATA